MYVKIVPTMLHHKLSKLYSPFQTGWGQINSQPRKNVYRILLSKQTTRASKLSYFFHVSYVADECSTTARVNESRYVEKHDNMKIVPSILSLLRVDWLKTTKMKDLDPVFLCDS